MFIKLNYSLLVSVLFLLFVTNARTYDTMKNAHSNTIKLGCESSLPITTNHSIPVPAVIVCCQTDSGEFIERNSFGDEEFQVSGENCGGGFGVNNTVSSRLRLAISGCVQVRN